MRIMRYLRHDNILKMNAAWVDAENYYILFDYAVNGDLTNFLQQHGPLSVKMTQFLAAHLINGLDYIRSQGIVHRDLKPANILLNENWVPQLADFGTAKHLRDDVSNASKSSDNVSHISTFSVSAVSTVSGISGVSANCSER